MCARAGHAPDYTFLYITLRQQDYALLMGTVALFPLLGIVMYVSLVLGAFGPVPGSAFKARIQSLFLQTARA